MPPHSTLPSVELVIPSDKFFEAMRDIGQWLTGHRIASPYCTSAKNRAGDHNLCIAFSRAREAANFAKRFDGRLTAADR